MAERDLEVVAAPDHTSRAPFVKPELWSHSGVLMTQWQRFEI